MATPPKKPKSHANQTLPADIQRAIELQTATFLKGGGQIQQIANGVSGQLALAGNSYGTWQAKPSAHAVPGTVQERMLDGNTDE